MRFARTHELLSTSGMLVALALSGCSDDPETAAANEQYPFATAPRTQQTVHPDIVKLIPRTASGLIHVPTPEQLRSKLTPIAKSIAPGLDKLIDIVPMVSQFGLRPRDLDLQRPGAVVLLTLPMVGGSLPMLVLPVKNAEDAADLVEGKATVSGQHLAIGIGEAPKLARKPSPLADAFPSGDIAIRLNLLRALQPFRELINKSLSPESLAKQDGDVTLDAASLQQMVVVLDGIKGLLGTARILDIAASLDQGSVDLDITLEVAKGSSWDQGSTMPSGELVHFARSLPVEDSSIVVLSTPVWSKWMNAFQGVYQDQANRMKPAQGQAFAGMVNHTKRIYDMLDVGVAAALKFGSDGLRAAAIFASDTPQSLVEQFSLICDQLDPQSTATPIDTKTGSASLTQRSVTVNPKDLVGFAESLQLPANVGQSFASVLSKLLGDQQLDLAVGVEGKRLGILCGNTTHASTTMFDALRSGGDTTTGLLAGVLSRLHATPQLLFACDVRQTLRDIRPSLTEELQKDFPIVSEGDPVVVWFSMSSSGRRYEVQLHVDLTELLALFR
ncbi:MAG: hypothetical protein VX951_05485 [Planctomycetota bacterium]|nr:hypothetical protein [Planctomycetota bacterium]